MNKGTRQNKKSVENSTLESDPPMDKGVENFQQKKLIKSWKKRGL